MMTSFAKTLSPNDVGTTGGHQAGILVPKGSAELMRFFPRLDPAKSNPDAWILCVDDAGIEWKLRYIYYNNRLHGTGTRNEYRITHLTRYLKDSRARVGDLLVFSATSVPGRYHMQIQRSAPVAPTQQVLPGVITLSGWRKVH